MSSNSPDGASDAGVDATAQVVTPFDPPTDFDHGEEFAEESPRPLPDFARSSRYVRARNSTVWSLGMTGGACLVTSPLPFVKALSWYLLPLGYLNWVGGGLIALAVIYWIRNKTTWGDLSYLRNGEPITGRVVHCGVNAEGTKEAPLGRFVAEVEYLNPELNQLQSMVVRASDTFGLKDLPNMDSGVSSGDYITLVYLPGRLESSLRIYGWMGLNPELELIQKNGKPLTPMSPVTAMLAVFAVTAIGWCLLAFLYAIGRYMPLDDNSWPIIAIAVGLASIPFVILMLIGAKNENATGSSPIKKFGFALFVGLMLGLMSGVPAVGFLNGYFDRSPPELQPVTIVQLWQQTTNFIIRTYELEYHPYPAGKTEKKMVPVEALSQFEPNSLGVIDIGNGFLGMRWLRNFHPIIWENVPNDEPDHVAQIKLQLPDQEAIVRIAPRVVIPNQPVLSPPAAMLPEVRARMIGQLKTQQNIRVIEPENQ